MATSTDPVLVARSRIARGTRWGHSPEVLDEARRDLTVVKTERAIRQALAAEPAITAEQRGYLASILMGGGTDV